MLITKKTIFAVVINSFLNKIVIFREIVKLNKQNNILFFLISVFYKQLIMFFFSEILWSRNFECLYGKGKKAKQKKKKSKATINRESFNQLKRLVDGGGKQVPTQRDLSVCQPTRYKKTERKKERDIRRQRERTKERNIQSVTLNP